MSMNGLEPDRLHAVLGEPFLIYADLLRVRRLAEGHGVPCPPGQGEDDGALDDRAGM